MKITVAKDNWIPVVTDLDLNTITKKEIDILACLANYHTALVIKGQGHVSQEVNESVALQIGHWNNRPLKNKGKFLIPGLQRTQLVGGTDATGRQGLFGMKEELVWHANNCELAIRESLVWLHGVHHMGGSITSMINMAMVWDDLPQDVKDKIKDLRVIYTYSLVDDLKPDEKIDQEIVVTGDFTPDLVHTNESGRVGLYFSFLQIERFDGMTREQSAPIIEGLRKFIFSNPNRYIYDHHWEDGDILLMDQWLGIHKRHAFERMDLRTAHRVAIGYHYVDFGVLDEALNMVEYQ